MAAIWTWAAKLHRTGACNDGNETPHDSNLAPIRHWGRISWACPAESATGQEYGYSWCWTSFLSRSFTAHRRASLQSQASDRIIHDFSGWWKCKDGSGLRAFVGGTTTFPNFGKRRRLGFLSYDARAFSYQRYWLLEYDTWLFNHEVRWALFFVFFIKINAAHEYTSNLDLMNQTSVLQTKKIPLCPT